MKNCQMTYQKNKKNQKRQFKKIDKHKVIERINIKEIESEILDETKALDEMETKLRKLETKAMKKGF